VAGAVDNLRRFLVAHHWKNNALIGPDPGLRFNYRIFRFIKGYFPQLPWNDDLYYLQCQAYWIMANWKLFDQTGQEEYRNLAVACSNAIVDHQRPDGAWD
jgi:hypothetical protein